MPNEREKEELIVLMDVVRMSVLTTVRGPVSVLAEGQSVGEMSPSVSCEHLALFIPSELKEL